MAFGQTFATTRLQRPTGRRSRRIRTLASRLPEIYAADEARKATEEDLRIKKESLEHTKEMGVETLALSRQGFKYQKEQDRRSGAAAIGGLGLTAGLTGAKMLRADPESFLGGAAGANVAAGIGGGVAGGAAGAGIATAVGAKKKGVKALSGAAGGAAMAYLGGGDVYSMGAGALIGGGIGALF